jgi:hypothetical protein
VKATLEQRAVTLGVDNRILEIEIPQTPAVKLKKDGSRTSTDVLNAAASLADSQSSEIRALADYQIAQIDLAFATGTLLGAAKVEWQPQAVEEQSEKRKAKSENPIPDPTPIPN